MTVILALAALRLTSADDPSKDPFEGLTEEQKHELIAASHEARNAAHEQFRERFAASGADLRGLERHEVGALVSAPGLTVEESVRAAAGAALVSVECVRVGIKGPEAGAMFATVKVERLLFGDVPGQFVVQQSGGPFNEQGEVVLLELRADPLLLPGDASCSWSRVTERSSIRTRACPSSPS